MNSIKKLYSCCFIGIKNFIEIAYETDHQTTNSFILQKKINKYLYVAFYMLITLFSFYFHKSVTRTKMLKYKSHILEDGTIIVECNVEQTNRYTWIQFNELNKICCTKLNFVYNKLKIVIENLGILNYIQWKTCVILPVLYW